ncbi:NAD/NADP octopine/nopaline dehydrogenase family protein [bacterium SCSIO 12696]|nr:NAD/NADP octopine/nopaline dehydrogenase family protein [bacterium SCSIO 12696]
MSISFSVENPTVCVIGGGNAAHVLAALLPSRNISTRVLATFGDEANRMAAGVAEQGHLIAEFAAHNAVAGTITGTPEQISADAAEVIPGSDVLLLPLPSFAYASVLETIKPYLKPGMAIGVTPGQGGFDWVAREVLGDLVDQLVLFAILPMPFNCRITDYGKRVEVQEFKHNYRVGVLPISATDSIIRLNEKLFGHTESCGHFLSSTLYPVNAILHPSRLYTLCKDWTPGQVLPENPLFYEGMTSEAAAMMNALNADLMAIGNALEAAGKESIKVPHIYDFLTRYVYEDNSPDLATFFRTSPAYKGFRCPFKEVDGGWEPDFGNRYFSEDIPLGLCVYKGVADLAGVETPAIDTVVTWAQQHMSKEYIVDGKLCGRDIDETHAPQRFGITCIEQL